MFCPMMTSSQEPQFLGKFLGFFKELLQNFPKSLWKKFSTFQGNFYLNYFNGIT